MQKWEYLTRFVQASNEGWGANESIDLYNKEYGIEHAPLKGEQYSPQYMTAILNNMGANGWEMVHMEPIAGVGRNHDVHFTGSAYAWSNAYFCV